MSQNDMILEYLSTGAEITALEALQKFQTLRLAARVHDLRRDGIDIIERTVTNNGKHYASYRLGVQYG